MLCAVFVVYCLLAAACCALFDCVWLLFAGCLLFVVKGLMVGGRL